MVSSRRPAPGRMRALMATPTKGCSTPTLDCRSRTGDDLRGTLCHFDFDPVDVSQEEFEFLRRAALLLPRYLPRG